MDLQAVGRANRVGRKKPLYVYRLCSEASSLVQLAMKPIWLADPRRAVHSASRASKAERQAL